MATELDVYLNGEFKRHSRVPANDTVRQVVEYLHAIFNLYGQLTTRDADGNVVNCDHGETTIGQSGITAFYFVLEQDDNLTNHVSTPAEPEGAEGDECINGHITEEEKAAETSSEQQEQVDGKGRVRSLINQYERLSIENSPDVKKSCVVPESDKEVIDQNATVTVEKQESNSEESESPESDDYDDPYFPEEYYDDDYYADAYNDDFEYSYIDGDEDEIIDNVDP